jgi:hypothetical protein
MESDTVTLLIPPFSSITFPRNGTDQREIKTTDLSVGKEVDRVSGVNIWGGKISREKAEMRVRNGNEHTHTAHAHTRCNLVDKQLSYLYRPLSSLAWVLGNAPRSCSSRPCSHQCALVCALDSTSLLLSSDHRPVTQIKAQNWFQDAVCRMSFIGLSVLQ